MERREGQGSGRLRLGRPVTRLAAREAGLLVSGRTRKEMRLDQGERREGLRAKTEIKKASTFLFLFQYFKCIFK
jgi:hypothetical protein